MRCTHPNAICIPNRTDVECVSNYEIYYKTEVVLEALSDESSQAELCRRHNLSENQVSTWKRQFLENAETFFESPEKHSDASSERIAQLEQIVGRLTLALEIEKKALTLLD